MGYCTVSTEKNKPKFEKEQAKIRKRTSQNLEKEQAKIRKTSRNSKKIKPKFEKVQAKIRKRTNQNSKKNKPKIENEQGTSVIMCYFQWIGVYDGGSEFKSKDPGFDPLAGQDAYQFLVPPSELLCRLVRVCMNSVCVRTLKIPYPSVVKEPASQPVVWSRKEYCTH